MRVEHAFMTLIAV